MFFVNGKLSKIHFWLEQKFKLQEDSMILAVVMYLHLYYYLLYTYLLSYFVEFHPKRKKKHPTP